VRLATPGANWKAQLSSIFSTLGAITINTTPILGGSSGAVLYDNAGTFGEASEFSISSGQPNVANGFAYLYNNKLAMFNVPNASGDNWFSNGSGNFTTTGFQNFGEGDGALFSITTGSQNVAIGFHALTACTDGQLNMCIGSSAGGGIVHGTGNMLIGSGGPTVDVTDFTCVGINAASNVTGGSETIAIGANVLASIVGGSTLNVAMGYKAGAGATSAFGNLFLGAVGGLAATVNNTIILQEGGNVGAGRADYNYSNSSKWTFQNGVVIHGDATLIHTTTALTNGAGASTATFTNAPAAGNPTKWIPIDDNGTTRYVPAF
jgi:hypothetical protein